MKNGKLSNEQLMDLVISRLPQLSANTLVGASIGADCAWLKAGDSLMVTSSDPITAGGKNSGTLAIHVSCNDIAACGVRPSGILIVIIAPSDSSEKDISDVVEQASLEASKLGVDIVGGHTEISDAVNRFIVISTAFGMIGKDHPVPAGKAKAGDKLVLTKTCGIEGSYILSHEHIAKLKGKMSDELIEEARHYNSLISVVDEGETVGNLAKESGELNPEGFKLCKADLMHDVTEGGVLGAAYEMAHFSDLGVTVDERAIPMTDATKEICSILGINPFRLISSGSLLISTDEPDAVIDALKHKNIKATVIGEFTEKNEGYKSINIHGNVTKMEPPAADELYKI